MKKFFKDKTIIITGHTGFKGAWLSLILYLFGAKVVGIAKDVPTNPSIFERLKLKNKIENIKLDLKNLKRLKSIILKKKPDYIFHLAAQSLVKRSFKDPVTTFNSNAIGTMNLLESLKFLKKKCIAVIITSDKSYKNLELKRGYKENDLLGGKDPYSASKAAAELIIQSYLETFFNIKKNKNIIIGIARAGNVIGGGDWSSNRLVPDCIKAWSKNKKVLIRNPNSTRPWQHVFEVLRGYLCLAIKLKKNNKLHGEAFNFGPHKLQNKTVIELIVQSSKFWKNIKWKISKSNLSEKESILLKLNSNKAKKKIKWEPKLNFSKAIEMTINWYKYFYSKKIDLFNFSLGQLETYFKNDK